VLIQWAFEYLTFNRGARLITGHNPPLPEIFAEDNHPAAAASDGRSLVDQK
jgi:hypothetical protein